MPEIMDRAQKAVLRWEFGFVPSAAIAKAMVLKTDSVIPISME